MSTISNVPQDRDEELREQILTNKRKTGGDPSLLLDLLSELVERESWKKRGEDGWSFLRYVQTPFDEGGLGFDREEVENIIQFRHKYEKDGPRHDAEKAEEMEELRSKVRGLLTPELGQHGGDRTEEKSSPESIDPNERGSDYLKARIARDHPDVHERLKDGEFRSVRQAAIEAGIIDDIRTKQIRETDGPEKMEAKIRHVYGDEVADRLFSGGADEKSAAEEKISFRDEDEPSGMDLAGPLKNKDPDSEEYAYQLVGLLATYAESLQTTLQEWDEIVEKAKTQNVHERLGYDSFEEMLEDRVGPRPWERPAEDDRPEINAPEAPDPEEIDPERAALYVGNLQSAYKDGERAVSSVPGHIKQIISKGFWRRNYCEATGELSTYDTFREFATAPPPEGLGANLDTLVSLCEDDPEALELLRQHGIGRKGQG